MKLTDLVSGDWVYDSGELAKLTKGRLAMLLFLDDDSRVSPIPLDKEILVKNGFALDKSLAEIGTRVYTRPCPADDLSVKVFHDGSIRFGFIKLTYVHQLQHLLKLCEIDKEIEL